MCSASFTVVLFAENFCSQMLMQRCMSISIIQQAGNGPSRRHIQGSKIAKGLQNFQVLVNWDYFYEKKNLKKVTQCREKTEREDPLGFFNIHSVAKLLKIEGRAFRGEKVFLKKVAQCRKNGPFGLVRYYMLCGKPF